MNTMKAARLHKVGEPMQLDIIPIPPIGVGDVRVKVHACNLVPNLHNILANWEVWNPQLPLPKLPAVFGLDSAGVVAEVGAQVSHLKVGQRVYVNPGVSCGSCPACRRSDPINCVNYTFIGYFGFGPNPQRTYDLYPLGGLAEYVTAPQANIVVLPDNVTFEQAARFGYLGTAFAALQKGQVRPDTHLLILGITGTLGVGCLLDALAMGITRIYGTGRNRELLEAVRKVAPDRVQVVSLEDGSIVNWAKEVTGGNGMEVVVNCLGPGAPASYVTDALDTISTGGCMVNVSGVSEAIPVDVFKLMCARIDMLSSNWFTTAQGMEMAELARVGLLDLSCFEQQSFPLDDVNTAINTLPNRHGGFSNFTVKP